MSLIITPILPAHFKQIKCIEHKVHFHPWSDKHLSDTDSRFACHQVLLKDGCVIGYYYAENVFGEMTLLNIAVSPVEQGKGYGRHLLTHLLDFAQTHDVASVWLEVRASNTKAFNLYESLGFNEVTRRIDYYPAAKGKEDAIVMNYTL